MKRIILSISVLIVILLLAGCGTKANRSVTPTLSAEKTADASSNTPLSGASATTNGLKLDAVEIDTSGRAKEGWKGVNIVLSAENVSETVGRFPSQFCGILIDTGGYERRAWVFSTGGLILAPGTRVKKMVVESEIPENQEPQSLTLYATYEIHPCTNWKGPSGPAWSFSDLTKPVSDLEYPYDTMPTIAPTVENGIFQYEEPGLYKVELSNFRVEKSSSGNFNLRSDYKVENTGGYDLRFMNTFAKNDDDQVLYILGAGNTGRYIEYELETNRVSPGMTDTGEVYLTFGFGVDEWIYFSLVPDSQKQPVAQMIFEASE